MTKTGPGKRACVRATAVKEVRKTGVILVCVAVLLGAVFQLLQTNEAPDVMFVTIGGERMALRDMRGHPVLVHFWATSCPSCIAEMPALDALYREFAGRGLRMVAVAMAYDPPNRVVTMVAAKALAYPVALDPLGTIARAFDHVELVPTSILVAPAGRIAFRETGVPDAAALRSRIASMLGGV